MRGERRLARSPTQLGSHELKHKKSTTMNIYDDDSIVSMCVEISSI